MKANKNHFESSNRLFKGERGLVITGMIGFILSTGIAIYIYFQGPIKPPEGNLRDAFSFNSAIGIFMLSIAAILPLTRFGTGRRRVMRWIFILASFYSYTIETVQNFRGISPRFSREGTVVDMLAEMLFGVVSLGLVIIAIVLTIHFLRMTPPFERPLLLMGIRYAFLSVFAANLAGLWMILLQDRLTGDGGNVIVLHGLGFHALQTLILLAWFLEKAQVSDRVKKRLIHSGCMAWMLSILLIGIQTAMGRTVFELTPLPILGCLLLLVWFGTFIIAHVLWIKKRKANSLSENQLPLMKGK